MKILVEVAENQILSVTAETEGVVLFVIDYDLDGARYDGQDCCITRHTAEVDARKVAVATRQPRSVRSPSRRSR